MLQVSLFSLDSMKSLVQGHTATMWEQLRLKFGLSPSTYSSWGTLLIFKAHAFSPLNQRPGNHNQRLFSAVVPSTKKAGIIFSDF